MRRQAGAMIPLEITILEASDELRRAGQPEVHGYLLAKGVQDLRQGRRLPPYGTLSRARGRARRGGPPGEPRGGSQPRGRRTAAAPTLLSPDARGRRRVE